MTYDERIVRDEEPGTVYDRGSAVVERRVTRTPSGGELASLLQRRSRLIEDDLMGRGVDGAKRIG